MTSQLFGWNINAAESNEAVVLDIVRRTKARSHIVMHGVTFARKVYDVVGQVTGEEPIIVCREDWPDDNWRDSKYSNMTSYFNQWKGRGGYWPGAYVYWLNEPVVGGNEANVRSLLAKSIEAMHASAATGVKAVIGNYADASLFEHHWLDGGLFDEWLRVASEYTNGGYGLIGHHNYSYGVAWTGSGGTPYDQLKAINPQPPSREAFQNSRWAENWLQGRFMFPLKRCDRLNIPRYRFVCTEGVWDRMPSGEFEGWIPATEAHWGLPKLRGPLDQRQLWSRLYPGMTPARAGVWQLEQLANLMAGLPCYGVHLFTLSYNREWTSFNFLEWPEFVNELAAYGQRAVWTPGKVNMPMATVPKPTTAPTPGRVVKIPLDYVNIREQPVISGRDVGDLRRGATVDFWPDKVHLGWVFVRTNTAEGWVSLQNGGVVIAPTNVTFLNPCAFPYVKTSGFGNRPTPEQNDGDKIEFHDGVDLAPAPGTTAPYRLVAPADGDIITGWDANGFGNYVVIDHKNGFASLLGHMSETALLASNTVQRGQLVGYAGSTGRSTGTHVHWRLTYQGVPIDPLPYMVDAIPEPPSEDDDTQPMPPVEEPPPLYATWLTEDEARQLAGMFADAAAIFYNVADRMKGQ